MPDRVFDHYTGAMEADFARLEADLKHAHRGARRQASNQGSEQYNMVKLLGETRQEELTGIMVAEHQAYIKSVATRTQVHVWQSVGGVGEIMTAPCIHADCVRTVATCACMQSSVCQPVDGCYLLSGSCTQMYMCSQAEQLRPVVLLISGMTPEMFIITFCGP